MTLQTRQNGLPPQLAWLLAALIAAAGLCAAAVAPAAPVRVIVYQHNGWWDEAIQFMTADPGEIRALDAGWLPGWHRSMQEFIADDTPGPGRVPVCRFYGARVGHSARHFYTADAGECEWLKTSSDWVYEGHAFYAPRPDATGACPAGTVPMYRSYRPLPIHVIPGNPHPYYDSIWERTSNGPQHRYAPVAAPTIADNYFGAWTREGVAFCVPASFDAAPTRLAALAGTWEFSFTDRHGTARSYLITFGAVDRIERLTEWSRAELLADYRVAVTTSSDGRPALQWEHAYWRPVEGKVVMLVGGYMLYFDYDGGTSIHAVGIRHEFDGWDWLLIPHYGERIAFIGNRR